MKKGFATSAILYTMLLLFLVLMVNILNNLQNKKVILDSLKKDTINALQSDVIVDAILEQVGVINNRLGEIEQKIDNYKANTYTKEEVDSLLEQRPLTVKYVQTEAELTNVLNVCSDPNNFKKYIRFELAVPAGLSLGGGHWVIETHCTDSTYGYQLARIYQPGTPLTLGRSFYNGVWGTWANI